MAEPNIFRKALAVLNERGWWHPRNQTSAGACLLEAIGHAEGVYGIGVHLARLHALVQADGYAGAVQFNDDPHTTEEDVRLLLKRAAVELEAEEGDE